MEEIIVYIDVFQTAESQRSSSRSPNSVPGTMQKSWDGRNLCVCAVVFFSLSFRFFPCLTTFSLNFCDHRVQRQVGRVSRVERLDG